MANKIKPFDSLGQDLVVGDSVLIVTIPEWLTKDIPPDEAAHLKSLVGCQMTVVELDTYGYAWFGNSDGSPWFCISPADTLVIAKVPGKASN